MNMMTGLDRRRMLGSVLATALAGAVPAAARTPGSRALKTAALQSLIDGFVADGRVPGAVVAIVEPGDFAPRFLSAGRTAFDGGAAVTPDTQWRIYSMSKPITGMAVMGQVALGNLRLDQPVADILPELARPRVLTGGSSLDSRPAERTMTVRHLITHTAGFTYAVNGNGLLEREYRRLGIQPGSVSGFLRPGDGPLPDLQAMVGLLGNLSLASEPGTAWRYSVGLDVAGALLERLTGQTLDKVLTAQLFGPLDMDATGFWAKDATRLAANYLWVAPDGRVLDKPFPLAPAERDGFTTRPKLLSGGGGLVSSARDYARFMQMLLNGGQFQGRTVLPRGTAELAMSNLLPPGVFFEKDNGFGAGGRLTLFDTRSAADGQPAWLYAWSGAAGTLFAVDRVRQMGVAVMLQFMPSEQFPLREGFRRALNRDADLR